MLARAQGRLCTCQTSSVGSELQPHGPGLAWSPALSSRALVGSEPRLQRLTKSPHFSGLPIPQLQMVMASPRLQVHVEIQAHH